MSSQMVRSIRSLKLAFALGAIFAVYQIGGLIEGRLFPVVKNTQIISVLNAGDGWSMINGTFDKARDCDFVDMNIFLMAGNRRVSVDYKFNGSEIRTPGKEDFGWWLVQLTEDQIRNRAEIEVLHDCHNVALFGHKFRYAWLTQTRFYP